MITSVVICMSNIRPLPRPGLTAIAAVLALSATPLFAQVVDPAAAPSTAPAVVTPPPVVTAPAIESAPAAVAAAPATQMTSPAPAGGVVTAPIIGTVTTPATTAAQTAAPVVVEPAPLTRAVAPAEPAPKPVTRSTTTRTAPVPLTAERTAAPVPAATEAPAPASLAPIVDSTPAPASAPIAAKAVPADASDDILPIAGAAGAAILLLGGGAYALSRRRKPGDVDYVTENAIAMPVEPVAYAPAPLVAPTVPLMADERAYADRPATAIPAGFDTSRFGRHTQAAYTGPTEANPFLSLKRRLKRASFLDGRERMATTGAQVGYADATAPAMRPATAARQTDRVTTRVTWPTRPGFRPAMG